MSEDWDTVELSEVLTQDRTSINVVESDSYDLLGVRWYAGGPFLRETVTGTTSKAKTFYPVKPDQFIYNRLFAWKGSFGLVGLELASCHVSNEFPHFDCDQDRLLPAYLCLWFQQPHVWQYVEKVSTGTTQSRSRWKESQFLSYSIPLPALDIQLRIVDLMEHLDSHLANLDDERDAATAAHARHRDELLSGWEVQPLSDFASVEAVLVDPRLPQYQELVHIGIDRIEKDTGRLLSLRTASAEGLVSAKFLFGPDDVIFAKIRPNLRKVVYPGFAGLCSADAYPLRPRIGLPPSLLAEAMLAPSVVDAVVAKSGRTKMPKVNRKELFSVPVPLGAPKGEADWAVAAADLEASARVNTALREEASALRRVRSSILASLLSGATRIPESYDALLGVG